MTPTLTAATADTLTEEAAAPARTTTPKTHDELTDSKTAADGKPQESKPSQARISTYRRATEKAPNGTSTIADFCREVRSGTHRETVERVRAAIQSGDKDAATNWKRTLPAVSLSGMVTTGDRAKAFEEGRFLHSGWMQIDLDAPDLGGRDPEAVRDRLAMDKHVQAAFLSPSGAGVKALLRVPACKAPEEHLRAFKAAEAHFRDTHGLRLDPATKDPGRLCFHTYDPAAAWNAGAVTPLPIPAAVPVSNLGPMGPKNNWNTNPADSRPRRTEFPTPPENGIHSWLMEGSWHCRLSGMSESDTVAKLQGYDGTLRRRLTPGEAEDAARKVFSTVLQSHATRSTITRIREAVMPENMPDLTRFGESDADNALRVYAVAGGNFHHVTETGQWLVWDGCRWVPDKDGKMVRLFLNCMEAAAAQGITMENRKAGEALVKHAMRCRDAAKVTSGLTMLKSVQGVTISANDLDADPWMLGTPSGLIDLRTGSPTTPDKQALVTKSIACDFDPDAACPVWESVIHTAAGGDAELIRFLQAWTGYTLTGSVKEECLAFLHGTGANSKGTVTECIRALMGDYAITAPESLFTADRNSSATNDIARLAGCRMACAAELDENASFAESRLKAITGRDAITARFLHREFFDFVPTHKLWISGNHKPGVRGVDHGIWRRIRLIPFTVTIPKERRDRDLADKLRAELPGILNWAIAGCMLWQREGLRTPACVAQATAEYQAGEDIVGQFLDDSTTTDTEERTLQSSLFERYQAWAEKQGIRKPMSATMLNRKLEERGLKRGKIRGGIFWLGIALKTEGGQETCPKTYFSS